MIVFRKKWAISNWKLMLLVIALLASASFTMARTSLLMTIASSLGAYLYSTRYFYKIRIRKRLLVYAFLGFVGISYLFAIGTEKIKVDSNFFFNYVTYPIVTFDTWVLGFPFSSGGTLTFPFLFKFLGILGLSDNTPVDIATFLGVPRGQLNTFTLLGAPYLDFGIGGVIFIFLGLGILFGFAYRQVRSGNPSWIIFSSILLYPLIMSFFEYQFSLSLYIYYATILFIVHAFGTLKKRTYSNASKSKKLA